MTARPRSWRAVGLVLAAVVLLAGCQARADIAVRVDDDGGGRVDVSVTLDSEAAKRVGEGIDLAGLAAAGWKTSGPTSLPDGGLEVRATKRFSDPAGAHAVLSEVGGGLSGFKVTRQRSWWKTDTSVTGTVDLTDWQRVYSDADLAEVLGSPLGVDQAELERQLGRPVDQAFRQRVRVVVPGSPTGASFAVVAPGAKARIATSSSAYNTRVLAPAGVSVLALLLAAASGARAVRRARRVRAIQQLPSAPPPTSPE